MALRIRFATGDRSDPKDESRASDPEAEHFARAMTDVVRLAPDPRSRVRVTPVPAAPKVRRPSTSTRSSPEPREDDSSEAGFVAPGVDRRQLRRLKRGEHAATGRLDLHGMTSAGAVASLKRFIDHERPRHRCVCIVHGRGLHSEGSVSVLKTRVRQWLKQQPAVLAFADAPRADGGSGAVYVLLRK
ncbi:MAG TPA: Smr/MutS family protein [Vicinamibacterales bacterium]